MHSPYSYSDAITSPPNRPQTQPQSIWEVAQYHARQVRFSTGQSRALHIRQCLDLMREALRVDNLVKQ